MAVFESAKTQKLKEGLQFDMNDATATERAHIEKILKWELDGFDTRTHIVDPKSGMLLKYQPYRRACEGSEVNYYRRDENGYERRYSESGVLLDAAPNEKIEMRVQPPEVKAKHDKRVSA